MKIIEPTNHATHWHLTFRQTNVDENSSDTLLSLSNSEENVKRIFGIAKAQYESVDPTDCIIDLRDNNQQIIDDCTVTFKQMKNLADLLGFDLKEPAPEEKSLLYRVK